MQGARSEVKGESQAEGAKVAFETTVRDDDESPHQSASSQGWLEAQQGETAAREAQDKAEQEHMSIARARMLRGAIHKSDARLAMYRARIAHEQTKEERARRKLDTQDRHA